MKLPIITIAYCCLLLSSCASTATKKPAMAPTLSATNYLQLADTATAQKKMRLTLKAITLDLNNHQPIAAQNILHKINTQQLPANLKVKYQLNQAKLYTLNRRFNRSQKKLNAIKNTGAKLTKQQRIKWYYLAIKNNAGANNIPSALTHSLALAQLIKNSPQQYQKVIAGCWTLLQNIPTDKLHRIFISTKNTYIKGWLALNNIIHDPLLNQTALHQQLLLWQHKYPNHIANALIPKSFSTSMQPINHIALLLPSTGIYQESAQAIKYGFLSAYFSQQIFTRTQIPTITFINTASQPIDQAYQQALNAGAQLIIGPLTKQAVLQLNNSTTIAKTTIALNTLPDDTTAQSNLYQLSLSPTDEIPQIVAKARADHHLRAIIITPDNPWGQQLGNKLTQAWQQAGGEITTRMNYPLTVDLTKQIRNTLGINLSAKRMQEIESIINQKVRMTPRIRQDFDTIFLIADTQHAKQIRPLLKFYFAGEIPIYAISNINQGNLNTQRDRDLDGILFCDIPWVLNNKLANAKLNFIRQQAQQTWPNKSKKLPKLFALGADAFSLATKFTHLISLPKIGFTGTTGTLYLTPQRKIIPTREWAEFIHGTASTHGIA